MKRMFVLSVSGVVLTFLSIPKQGLVAASEAKASPLVQVIELTGDKVEGFRRSCLLVRSDGEYHSEIMKQEHPANHAHPDWQAPEIFESSVSEGDLQKLKEIVESESFREINGTLGGLVNLRSRIAFAPPDGVVPLDFVEVLEVSVAHSAGPQHFEILDMANAGQATNSIKLFKRWIAEVQKRKDGRLQEARVTTCAISAPTSETVGLTATHLVPKPLYTPDPDYPAEEKNAKHTGTVTVNVLVNSDGSVQSASVRHGINPVLDRCASDALKKWKFAPALLAGVAVPMSIDLDVRFPSR